MKRTALRLFLLSSISTYYIATAFTCSYRFLYAVTGHERCRRKIDIFRQEVDLSLEVKLRAELDYSMRYWKSARFNYSEI